MIIYIAFIIMLFLLMGIYEINQLRAESISIKNSNDKLYLHHQRFSFTLVIAALLVVCLSALRYDVGWDYMAYYETIVFDRITNIVLNQEYLTILLISIAQKLNIPQIYFAINSIITICLIIATVRRYSKDYWVSLFLFVTFPLFYLNSLSVIRNFTAIAITFYGFKYIENKNFIRYVIIVIIASLFHRSAIITISFYFLRNIKLKKGISFLILILSPLLSNIMNQIVRTYFPKYSVYTSLVNSQQGTKAIFILLIIGVIAILLKDILDKRTNSFNIYFNIYFIGICIYLTFYKQGTMGHRLSLYGTIYSLLVLPDIIKVFKYKQDRGLIKILFYMLCVTMFLYTINIGKATYLPYKIFF